MEQKKPIKLYIMRHAESISNVAPDGTSIYDPELTMKGIEQAKHAREFFVREQVDVVICSSLTRCLQTASLVFHDKKVFATDILRETVTGVPCNSRHALSTQRIIFPGIDFDTYFEEYDRFECDYAEMFSRAKKVMEFLETLRGKYDKVVLLTHGNFGSALMHLIVDVPGIHMGNCEHNIFHI